MKFNLVTKDSDNKEAREILESINKTVGMTPNVYAAMANSPLVLSAYLEFSDSLQGSMLPALLREKIALTVSGVNACEYCQRAHYAVGRSLKADADELKENIKGCSIDGEHGVALTLASEIVENKGRVSQEVLKKALGIYGEKGIVEIYAVIMVAMFGNYFNHLAETEPDFPEIR